MKYYTRLWPGGCAIVQWGGQVDVSLFSGERRYYGKGFGSSWYKQFTASLTAVLVRSVELVEGLWMFNSTCSCGVIPSHGSRCLTCPLMSLYNHLCKCKHVYMIIRLIMFVSMVLHMNWWRKFIWMWTKARSAGYVYCVIMTNNGLAWKDLLYSKL